MIEIIDIKLYHYIEYFILHITHFVDILYRENGKICLLILSPADQRPSELDETLQLKLKFKYLNNFKCPHFTGMGNNTFTLKF